MFGTPCRVGLLFLFTIICWLPNNLVAAQWLPSNGSLNLDQSKHAGPPIVTSDANNIYVVFSEESKIVVKKFDGTQWIQVGGLVYDQYSTTNDPYDIAVVNEIPYVIFRDISNQILVKSYRQGSWQVVGGVLDSNGSHPQLEADNGQLYVAWVNSETIYVNMLANDNWVDVGTAIVNTDKPSLSVHEGTPYLGCLRDESSTWINYVYRFDGSAWLPMGNTLGNTAGEPILAFSDTAIYAAWSEVTSITPPPRPFTYDRIMVSRWTGVDWVDTGFNSLPKTVNSDITPSMATYGEDLYIAWSDATLAGPAGNNKTKIKVAKWDGSLWQFVGESLNVNDEQNTLTPNLTIYLGKLYVAWNEFSGSIKQLFAKFYNIDNPIVGKTKNAAKNIVAYPNPAKSSVRFYITETIDKPAKIQIYNSAGELIGQIALSSPLLGNSPVWDCSSIASGVYFYRLLIEGENPAPKLNKLAIKQ